MQGEEGGGVALGLWAHQRAKNTQKAKVVAFDFGRLSAFPPYLTFLYI